MTATKTPIRSCYTCDQSLTCFLRIEFARTTQSFKLLAETTIESTNTETPATTVQIWETIAKACTAYKVCLEP